jgi:aryl-alcohol dehydrogenase-like predicted oxidoreductase
MEYRQLGRSDIRVSAFGLGVMTFGAQTSEEDAFHQLDLALEAGITLFDTAENYPAPVSAATQGRSEEILGRWVKARKVRDKVVIATKVAGPGNGPGDMTHIRGAKRCLDRANIAAAVDASLQRLGVDVIDLYQIHWPERPITTLRRARFSHIPDTPDLIPLEDTLAALSEQVSAGKIRQIGICNESPWGAMRYLALAEQQGLVRIASIQNSYSLLDRSFEIGLAEIAMREQTGLIGFSPLSSGLLTGKYRNNAAPIAGSRSSLFAGFETRFAPSVLQAADAYAAIAEQHGLAPAHLALAFAAQQPFMTSVLMAASSAAQLAQNLGAIAVKLPKEVVKQVNDVHDSYPNPR